LVRHRPAQIFPALTNCGAPPPAGVAQPDAGAAAGVVVKKKTGRELWEEDRRREASYAVAPLLMGDQRMCETGGCGYFSDDGK